MTDPNYIRAYRLINTPDGGCTFEPGKLPTKMPMETGNFWIQNEIDEYEKISHPAPRNQYVVTLKGTLRFKVTDGTTFIIEPGIILIAEDTIGKGHSWELIEGETWERLYIPLAMNASDNFIPEKG
ncbi:hypothetical protein PBAL39_00537 [Pedobacter sp. BAL39]|uniref:hypothetical protein n=1 Tax=Pedobacter sp. BAL39 TaxID=391596 RepID=UPI0001559A8D|nr:hypothetical protein [Pedobacter sp. BAL39]EDM38056.1 hypothetical protein PBAL39_00537 [Pedobacter sp. BAL39]